MIIPNKVTPERRRLNLVLPDTVYFDLEYEADQKHMSMQGYIRSILENRSSLVEKPKGRSVHMGKDLAETIATALAVIIITGAVTTDGLEKSVESTTLEIMQYLGFA